jgi:hypothetical protein
MAGPPLEESIEHLALRPIEGRPDRSIRLTPRSGCGSTDDFKVGAVVMSRFDALPSTAYRALCNDFNLHAGELAARHIARGNSPRGGKEDREVVSLMRNNWTNIYSL